MLNFDVVDFSEHRTEEVISFFWRSVYISFCWDQSFANVTFAQRLCTQGKWCLKLWSGCLNWERKSPFIGRLYIPYRQSTLLHFASTGVPGQCEYRPIYIGKNQNPKNLGFFCWTVYTARKTHNFSVFGQLKRMREKTWISYCFFW